MSYQQNLKNWHLLADKFIWYNLDALKEIPEEITDDEIQTYLFTYHGDKLSLEEIRQWREGKLPTNNH